VLLPIRGLPYRGISSNVGTQHVTANDNGEASAARKREQRLAEALRANLRKRKAPDKAVAPERPETQPAVPPEVKS
jgi:hypothetical protein